MKIIIWWLVIVTTWSRSDSLSCTDCVINHPQQEFCSSDFAIKAKVLSSGESSADYEAGSGYRSHEVEVQNWFKIPDGVEDMDQIIVLNNRGEEDCGPRLEVNRKYLIMGKYNETDGSFQIPFCTSFNLLWGNVLKGVKHKLRNQRYKNNCECQVRICPEFTLGGSLADPTVTLEQCMDGGPDRCTSNLFGPENVCRLERAICRRNRAGQCVWRTFRGYPLCLEGKNKK